VLISKNRNHYKLNKILNFRISPCEKVQYEVDTSSKEMWALKCNNVSLNFDVNFPIHPEVKEKMNYWKNTSTQKPLNVIFLGIDTVSRSHAFRGLPKTMEVFKQMEFIDFQAYHSVAPSTLTNFMAFLMGLTRKEVRLSCTSSWSSPFDSCPFIWKNYSDMNYVTMYAEDGEQTFNWGGQSGFKNKPTDYYIHSLFNSIPHLRLKSEFPVCQSFSL
jgi:hypothetical protein